MTIHGCWEFTHLAILLVTFLGWCVQVTLSKVVGDLQLEIERSLWITFSCNSSWNIRISFFGWSFRIPFFPWKQKCSWLETTRISNTKHSSIVWCGFILHEMALHVVLNSNLVISPRILNQQEEVFFLVSGFILSINSHHFITHTHTIHEWYIYCTYIYQKNQLNV